jgi:NADPH2:quinone reductase
MRAIVRQQFGGPEQLLIKDISTPEPKAGEVLLRVKAFGLNRAEQYFREGKWGDVAAVSGIECVGEVEKDGDSKLQPGQQVIALMGGMGRTIAGSYAAFVCVPTSNVVTIKTTLAWKDLAAIPESYATAWTCLNDNLEMKTGHVIVIRGAGSALGQAAVNIAAKTGARVIATVRTATKSDLLRLFGAELVLIETPELGQEIRSRFPDGVDGVLDIVGNTTILDSLRMVRPRGRVCLAGFLGGSAPIAAFDPLMQMPSGVHLSFFASAFVYGSESYPLTDIPFQHIVDNAACGKYNATPSDVFKFEDIQSAHRMLDAETARGKIVVVL